MQIIGTLRKKKAWVQIVLLCAFCLLPYCITYLILKERSLSSGYALAALVSCLFAPFGLVRAFQVARQLLLFNGQAVWIHQTKLVFLDQRVLCVPIGEIISVRTGREKDGLFLKSAVIVLELKNGQRKSFPTASLRESPEELVHRLQFNSDNQL